MPRKKAEPKTKRGRPLKIDDEIVKKLESAFQNGMNVREACWLSEIAPDTYYRWLKMFPDFSVKMERAQGWLVMKAKQTMAEAVNDKDAKASAWWLERRARDEFATKGHVEDDTEQGASQDAAKVLVALVKELNGTSKPRKKKGSSKKDNKDVLQD